MPDQFGLDPLGKALMSGMKHATKLLNAGLALCSSAVQEPGPTKRRMRYRVVMLLAAYVVALTALAGPVAAQPYRARQGVQSGQVRSLDQILNGIRRQRPGNLADVQGPNPSPEGGARYRLKWVTPDGRVLWLDTDARTGRVLGVEGDDRGPPAGAGPGALPPGYGTPQSYPVAPGYGRAQPGYGPPQQILPQPPAYGPPQSYPVPQGYGPPRGFIMRTPPQGVVRVPPGRGREYWR